MAKYRITKQVDFGPYTILGKSGLQSDQVPLNNYAPNIGDIIEGEIGSQVRHGITITGVIFPIATNGAASTTGQMSTQIVPLEDVEIVTPASNDQPVPSNPSNGNPANSNPSGSNPDCWFCKNKWTVLIIAGILIILAIIFYNK